MNQPSRVAEILALLTADPGRPRLTWYGGAGERIELSGAVLANWVSKTTNLLVEEFDGAPGVRVGLDLPAHWRTAVWAFAAWRCGACVVLGPGAADCDVVVTDRPDRHAGAAQLVAVALPGLARRFAGPMPPGTIDAAGAVMTYGDVVGWAPPVEASASALDGAGGVISHAELVPWSLATTASPGARTLVPAGAGRDDDVAAMLRTVTGVLAGAGSVVLVGAEPAAELAQDPQRLARLVASERIDQGTSA
ncbi:TIGR03089 family protein [Pengzhenrongella sicca]|uniref:TIGR03089 family protein n=1 Tax=Pengzhenrongella sicca TaxID=2819238 RepID=A0A8A4ZH16_9MICO|nr:TIGR03089 family protein [Pengzhenrongella sicca]QTE30253.1 TIGR03089 family protein [Pengzhenrongella sicca]